MAAGRSSRRRPPSLTADDETGTAEEAAVRLLARREHARRELAAKLERRGFSAEAVSECLERLAERGWQSDARFAEGFVAERFERGDGPLKIRSALAERGVDASVVDAALDAYDNAWEEAGEAALQRRFGASPAPSVREQARRARFLQQRGFPAGMVRRLVRVDESMSDD